MTLKRFRTSAKPLLLCRKPIKLIIYRYIFFSWRNYFLTPTLFFTLLPCRTGQPSLNDWVLAALMLRAIQARFFLVFFENIIFEFRKSINFFEIAKISILFVTCIIVFASHDCNSKTFHLPMYFMNLILRALFCRRILSGLHPIMTNVVNQNISRTSPGPSDLHRTVVEASISL